MQMSFRAVRALHEVTWLNVIRMVEPARPLVSQMPNSSPSVAIDIGYGIRKVTKAYRRSPAEVGS